MCIRDSTHIFFIGTYYTHTACHSSTILYRLIVMANLFGSYTSEMFHSSLRLSLLLCCSCFFAVSCQQLSCTRTQSKTASVVEGVRAGEVVTTVTQRLMNYELLVYLGSGTHSNLFNEYFEVVATDWTIRTKREVNRDAMAGVLRNYAAPVVFTITFEILQFSDINNVTCIDLTLNVIDIDNNVPRFTVTEQPYRIGFDEGLVDVPLSLPEAVDHDEGINGTTNYTLVDGHDIFWLQVTRDNEGEVLQVLLRNNVELDAEMQTSYNLTIIAREGNENPDEATLHVIVTPNPICDETPYFPTSRYFATVEEESPTGTVAFSNLSAIDHDIGGQDRLEYSISTVCRKQKTNSPPCITATSYPFHLDLESGILTIDGDIDREEYAEYEVGVHVSDTCQRTATATVVVTLEDINDNTPVVSCAACLNGVSEVSDIETVAYLNIEDEDAGENGNVSVRLYENRSGNLVPSSSFYLDGGQLKRRSRLDFEEEQIYYLLINASDHGSPTPRYSLFNISITVQDFNDNPPVIHSIQSVYTMDENPTSGREIVNLNATDLDSVETGNGVVRYILPPSNASFPHQHLFNIETYTGRLLVSGTLDREQQESLSILVVAMDEPMRNPPMSSSVVVNITLNDLNDYCLLYTSPSPRDATLSRMPSSA